MTKEEFLAKHHKYGPNSLAGQMPDDLDALLAQSRDAGMYLVKRLDAAEAKGEVWLRLKLRTLCDELDALRKPVEDVEIPQFLRAPIHANPALNEAVRVVAALEAALAQKTAELEARIAEYQALVLRRSGASSWQEWCGDWDPTEESADAYIDRLRGRIAELEKEIYWLKQPHGEL